MLKVAVIGLALALGAAAFAAVSNTSPADAPGKTGPQSLPVKPSAKVLPKQPTEIGINLFGANNFNRQQVYLNLIAQSEWFSSNGDGWGPMPANQLDGGGWVRHLKPGQTAPRPLVIPPSPHRPVAVRCEYEGMGELEAGGVARVVSRGKGSLMLELSPTGAEDEGGWIELMSTDPADPVRNIDCREPSFPRNERFHPAFLESLKGFATIRFLDWQHVNDNADVSWSARATPASSSQVSIAGASIEDMVDVANRVGANPWFLMPYKADEEYIRQFAQLVHDRVNPGRTVYVELGNEVWNDMFDAAQQAEREGVAFKLATGDPKRAQMLRYAAKTREAMKVWTEVFADRPGQLVRVASSQHAWPDLAEMILGSGDTAQWVDALATAPYIWLELDGMDVSDVDRVFAEMPAAIDRTMKMAEQNREIAARYGKRLITYEGGQHLVTRNLALARALQRDPRMGDVYRRYLAEWDNRMGGLLTLYASNAPIAEYGSWGLTEYGGQPIDQAPKLRAVRAFQGHAR
jgi:hypothetical protein